MASGIDEADKDLLIQKRNALSKKKLLIDAIEQLRQEYSAGRINLATRLRYIVDKTGIGDKEELERLLDSLEDEGAISFRITTETGPAGWGYHSLEINITDSFDEISQRIRKDFHELGKRIHYLEIKSNIYKHWVYYTNPFWLIYIFVKKMKILKFIEFIVKLIFK